MTTYTTNVPPISFTDTGLVLPAESAILTGVQADLNTAFGGNLNTNLNTPQGQIAQSMTAVIGTVNDEFASIVANIDPSTASGAFQDAIGRIYFMTRIAAAATAVTCVCEGVAGTVIPAGSLAQDTSGYTYASTASATLGVSGTASVQFQNNTTGPIACAPNTLVGIVTSIAGWDTINNPAAGIVGNAVETQQEFEYRRRASVAANAGGTCQRVLAAVFDVTGVTDAYVIDNPTNSSVTFGSTNYSLSPHSIYIGVVGGTSTDIATAIWNSKDAGCDMVGNTTVVVSDSVNYNYPYPSWNITYNIPSATPCYFVVNIKNNTSLPSTIIADTKAAIVNVFNGTSNPSTKMRIGQEIFSGNFYPAVSGLSPVVNIVSLFVGTSVSPTSTTVTMGIDQVPTVAESNIVVNLV